MGYTKTQWQTNVTPLSKDNMNHLETQYDEAAKLVDGLYRVPEGGIPDSTLASTFIKTVNGVKPDPNGNVAVSGGGGGGGGGTGTVTAVNGVGPDGSGNVALSKDDLSLGNVDDTSDADKPVSTLQQAAITAALSGALRVVVYASGAYPARPSTSSPVRYIGPVQPTTWITNDEWVNNS